MPRRSPLTLFILCAALACAAPVQAQTPTPGDAKPAIASFFDHPAFGRVVLSPSARYLAVRAGAASRNDFLVVIDLSTNKPTVVASFDDADIDDFEWINDHRLVFNVTEKNTGNGNMVHGPGLYAVDRDGQNFVQLAERDGGGFTRGGTIGKIPMQPYHTFMMRQRPRKDDSTYVLSPVHDTGGEHRYTSLIKLDTRTGKTETVARPDPAVNSWWLDHDGQPRLAGATHKGTTTLYYREPASGEWRTLTSFKTFTGSAGAFRPVGFGPDGTLYVIAQNGHDTQGLYTFDLKAGKINPEPLLVTKGYDFEGGLVISGKKVLGARFTTDATSIEWFDPGMKALQDKLDKLLPATINLVTVPAQASPWVLVASYSDAIPASYTLYNTDTGQVNQIGSSRPSIDPKKMGRQKMVSYKARDGMEIPALLTLPRLAGNNGKNLPMVVLVHGGPYVKGTTWGWNPETQFLASRGYAVLEPAFRGSTGYGFQHFHAGWKQWGLAMQNDVADGTRWAIAQGVADPKRICIAGASYGGYATLMGLVNDPDLYKCGIDWVGVTDIDLLYNGAWNGWSDMSEEYKQYGMPELVGDPVKDAAQLKATSPIAQAARIHQPLLLAYGGSDHRVPIYHGKQFYDAVSKTNKNVEWIEYPEEGHGWRLPKNAVDFWGRVEKFLDKNIGAGAAPQ